MTIQRHIFSVLLICTAGMLAYGGSIGNGFTFDDHAIVDGNPAVARMEWHRLLGASYWSATGTNTGLYRPVTLISLALNHWALGAGPAGYHAVNIALHLAIAGGLYGLALQALPWSASLLAGLIFATHPAVSEAINAVVGRADLLSAALALGAVGLLWPLSPAVSRQRAALAGVALLAAQLAKENGLVVATALALAALIRERRSVRLWLAPTVSVAVATALRLAVTGHLRPGSIGFIDNPLAYVDPWARLANGLAIAVRYLRLLVFPWPLSADYSYNQIPALDPWGPEAGLAALLILSLAAVSFRLAAVSRAGLMWWGIGATSLALVSHLATPLGTIFAERLVLVPASAYCLLCGWSLARTGREGPGPGRALATLLGAAWITAATGLSAARTGEWESDLTLFRAAAATSPGSARTHYGLGRALHSEGRLEAALAAYDRALRIYPPYAEAHYNRGAALLSLQREAEALLAYERAASCRPLFARAQLAAALLAERHHGPDRAAPLYEQVLQSEPGNEEAAARLSQLFAAAGDRERAAEVLERALRSRPSPRLTAMRQRLQGTAPPAP